MAVADNDVLSTEAADQFGRLGSHDDLGVVCPPFDQLGEDGDRKRVETELRLIDDDGVAHLGLEQCHREADEPQRPV